MARRRAVILRLENGLPFWQVGNEGGFLPEPVELPEVLLGPAERADVIVDFTNVPAGSTHRWASDERDVVPVLIGLSVTDTASALRRWAAGQPPTNGG